MQKKRNLNCTNCGVLLEQDDFIVHSIQHNVTLCKDCYDIPAWYNLINEGVNYGLGRAKNRT